MFIPSKACEVLDTHVLSVVFFLLLYIVLIIHVQYAYFGMIWKLPLVHQYVYFQQLIFSSICWSQLRQIFSSTIIAAGPGLLRGLDQNRNNYESTCHVTN